MYVYAGGKVPPPRIIRYLWGVSKSRLINFFEPFNK